MSALYSEIVYPMWQNNQLLQVETNTQDLLEISKSNFEGVFKASANFFVFI